MDDDFEQSPTKPKKNNQTSSRNDGFEQSPTKSKKNNQISSRITDAVKALQNATKITGRRKCTEEIIKLLNDSTLCLNLKKEAVEIAKKSLYKLYDEHVSATKHLRFIYRSVMKAMIKSTETILNGKTKIKSEDIKSLYKVFCAIDSDSNTAMVSSKQKQNRDWYHVPEPYTFESFDRYRDTNDIATYLSDVEINSLVNFTIKCLDNEVLVRIAETELLDLLFKLCSRRDYVSLFGTSDENIMGIINVIGQRVACKKSIQMKSSDIICPKILYNLIHNLVAVLGIDIQIFVHQCLSLLQDWAQQQAALIQTRHSQALEFMYGVAVDIYATYPDLCVGILSNKKYHDIGKELFNLAKLNWRIGKTKRDALVRFFAAHLLLCETAGKLESKMPGDLGNIGPASLNEEEITNLTEMILSESALEACSTIASSDNANTKRISFNPLGKRERNYLELCARLLRCVQRYFLMNAEKEASGQLVETLVQDCRKRFDDEKEGIGKSLLFDGLSSDRCNASTEALTKSPWINLIMKRLCNSYNWTGLKQSSRGNRDVSNIAQDPSCVVPANTEIVSDSLTKSEFQSNNPMRLALRILLQKGLSNGHQSVEKVITYLQIMNACAEVFPRGECWSSSNEWYKTEGCCPFSSHLHENTLAGFVGSSYCNACSGVDMASLIHSIIDILEHYGVTGGNRNVQLWGLVCLLKLTQSSSIAARYWKKSKSSARNSDDVPLAWQRAWETLLRNDLRYVSYTATASVGSHGQLVLNLLTEIVKDSLTALTTSKHNTFLINNQESLWYLPVFRTYQTIESSAPFELIAMIVNCVGLVEGKNDGFDHTSADKTAIAYVDSVSTRRLRIINFSLKSLMSLYEKNEVDIMKSVIPFLTAILLALTDNRKCVPEFTTYTMQSRRVFRTTESRHCWNEKTIITDNSKYNQLWKDVVEPFSFQYGTETNPILWDYMNGYDVRLCPMWSGDDYLWLQNLNPVEAEIGERISPTNAKGLQHFVCKTILNCIQARDSTGGNSEPNERRSASNMMIFKVVLALKFLNDRQICDVLWSPVEEAFDAILRSTVKHIIATTVEHNNISTSLSNLVGIIRLLKASYMNGEYVGEVQSLLSSKQVESLRIECTKVIKSYRKYKNNHDIRNQCHAKAPGVKFGDDDDDFFTQSKPLSQYMENDVDNSENDDDLVKSKKRKQSQQIKALSKKIKRNDMLEHKNGAFNAEEIKKSIDYKGLWLCVYIVVLLDPSITTCNMIMEDIIWPKEGCLFGTSDPHDFILGLSLLNTHVPFSIQKRLENDEHSMLSTCIDLIKDGRDDANAWSPYYMFGFLSCKTLFETQFTNIHNFRDKDVKELIGLLLLGNNEKKMSNEEKRVSQALKTHPNLRICRIQASMCFVGSDDSVRIKYEKEFNEHIVMASLNDSDCRIRQVGLAALGVVFAYLQLGAQQNVIKEALDRIPSLDGAPILTESSKTFEAWLDSRMPTVGKNFIEFEEIVLQQSSAMYKANIIHCLSLAGGKLASAETAIKVMTYLLQSKENKFTDQLVRCKCMEAMAHFSNFDTLEDLVQKNELEFLQHWICSKKPLSNLPLTLCCSSILRSISRVGIGGEISFSTLHQKIAQRYVEMSAHKIIPLIFIQNILDHNEYDKVRDRQIKEVARICESGDVSRLLRHHVYDIYAYIMPMKCYREGSNFPLRQRAEHILSYLHTSPKLGLRYVSRSAHLVIQQILYIYSINFQLDVGKSVGKSITREAIENFAKTVMIEKTKNCTRNCLFQRSGSSITECLLHARHLMNKSIYANGKKQAWSIIDFVVDEVQRQLMTDQTNLELGYCINSLLIMSLDSRHIDQRCVLLQTTKTLLQSTMRDNVIEQHRKELKHILNKVIATMIQIHEEAQQNLVKNVLDSWQESRKNNDFSPLRLFEVRDLADDNVDPIEMALEKYMQYVPSDMLQHLNLSYEILELVSINISGTKKNDLPTLDPFPEPALPEVHRDILMRRHAKYELTSVLKSINVHYDSNGENNISMHVKRLEFIANRYTPKSPTSCDMYSSDMSIETNDIESRALLSGIVHIKESIESELIQSIDDNEKETLRTVFRMLKILFRFCSDQYPSDVQDAGGKCLGTVINALQVSNFDIKQMKNITTEKRTFFQEDPTHSFLGDILNRLVNYIQADDTDYGLVAKDTLKSFLFTKDRESFFKTDSWSDSNELRRMVTPFFNTERSEKYVQSVPAAFSSRLRTITMLSEDEFEQKIWCWNEELWKCSNVTFEEWIRNVVCAMLICCYGNNEDEQDKPGRIIKGSSDFFRSCTKLCALDHEFASALFPAILFDILSSDKPETSPYTQETIHGIHLNRDNLIGIASSLSNDKITKCFSCILNPAESDKKSDLRAVNIALKFLDIMRCITEHKFYSKKYLHNKMRISGRTYDAKKQQVKIDDPNQSYNEVPSSPLFSGRPYGVILGFKDNEIASSYLRLKDFSAALYYAEQYADNRLGGSGSTFEMLSSRNIRQTDLSGFGDVINPDDISNEGERAIALYEILKSSYSELHDMDNMKGLQPQMLNMYSKSPDDFKDTVLNLSTVIPESIDMPVKRLMYADTKSQVSNGRGAPEVDHHLAVISSISELGLRDTLRHYLAGFSISHEALSSCSKLESSHIKEKWAEESWRLMQWDEAKFPKCNMLIESSENVSASFSFGRELMHETLTSKHQKPGYHESFGNLLSALSRDDISGFTDMLRRARLCLIDEFNCIIGTKNPLKGLQSSPCLRLATLNEIEDLGYVVMGETEPSTFIDKWCCESNYLYGQNKLCHSFSDIETAMASREVGLKLMYHKFGERSDDDIGRSYLLHLYRSCSIARQNAKPNVARAVLERMRRFWELNPEDENNGLQQLTLMKFKLEEARNLHSDGDTTSAVRTCKLIISCLNNIVCDDPITLSYLQSDVLLQCGNWLTKHKIEPAINVLCYLKTAADKSIEIHKHQKNDRSISMMTTSHFVLAEFVATLYDSADERVNSPEWKHFQDNANRRKDHVQTVREMIHEAKRTNHRGSNDVKLKELHMEGGKLKIETDNDKKEIKALQKVLREYLTTAIQAYGTALSDCTGIEYNSRHVFRVFSLWFRNTNSDDGTSDEVNEIMAKLTDKIPSCHFVKLIYQIFSRIDCEDDDFQHTLQLLIRRICKDHPYHGLMQLFALANGTNVEGRGSDDFINNVGHAKVEASSKLLRLLEQECDGRLHGLIQSYRILIDSYIALANAPTDQYASKGMTKGIPIKEIIKGNPSQTQYTPLDSCLRRCRDKPCILTKIPNIQTGTDYGDGTFSPVGSEFISSFHASCSITETGVHRPKIVICQGSNGTHFKQLVKGEDDIRQDAIIQQVFQNVNALFRFQDPSSDGAMNQQMDLKLHTYTCIPLTPKTGVIEWVANTTSFGDFLYRSGRKLGAHEKYYPGEWDVSLCRNHASCSPKDKKRASYDTICKNFSPCFRYFFLERFSHSPQRWHDARMSYIRSCAVNSIVGHVLGIGDRHSHNILIHEKTGEVVHIDFGIVFEQGKTLPIPETVPFRLTRDVVDGFGPIGTDGAFVITAQSTAKVLRDNANSLITILSAVVSDPLYSWNVNPVKAKQRGDENTSIFSKEFSQQQFSDYGVPEIAMMPENDNEAARRAITKVSAKLKGYEEGTSGERQSVEGQVQLLINAARDPNKLCMIYHGWMPWL